MPEHTPDNTTLPPKKRARMDPDAAVGLPVKTSAHGTSRNRAYTGKLAGLMHMPMDIFFEIASHLHPLDLLHISRTSKQLRSVVLTRKSRFIWLASLGNIDSLPPCPEAMSEPAYAALLFDRLCSLCSAPRAFWVDYAIRLRLCKSCYKDNIKKGQDILPNLDRITQRLLMAMTPCETGKNIAVAEILELPLSHKASDKYYVPQLEAMTTRQVGMKMDDESVEDYLNFLVSDSMKIHKHATALLRWESNVAMQKQNEEDALKASRKASITEKLLELGYAEDGFPSTKEWSKLVDQPKELTYRIWHNIQPKLEVLLEVEKERRINVAFEARVCIRLNQISVFYKEFVAEMPETERVLMPNLFNAHRLASLAALARAGDAQGDVARADFAALAPQLLEDVEAYKVEARATAAALIRQSASYKPSGKAWQEELDETSADEAVTRHYALFRCDMWPHSENTQTDYLTFEQVHDHWRTQHPRVGWGARQTFRTSSWVDVGCSGDYIVGGKMLDAVGLPRDTPLPVLSGLVRSGRLYCSCGDPALPPPEELDWPQLFKHVSLDLWRFERRMDKRAEVENPKLVLRSHHPLTGPDARIKLLPEGTDTAPSRERANVVDAKTRGKIEERFTLRPSPGATLICRICKALTEKRHLKYGRRMMALPETPEGIVHHLRGWHEKEFEKRDILFYTG